MFISFPFLRDGFLTTHLPVRVCDEASAHKGSDFILNVIFSPVTSLSYAVPSNCFKHSMLKVPTFWLIAFWESPHWCRNTIFMMSNCNVCVYVSQIQLKKYYFILFIKCAYVVYMISATAVKVNNNEMLFNMSFTMWSSPGQFHAEHQSHPRND